MDDIERVKQGIKACWIEHWYHRCFDCPYKPDRDNDNACVERLGADALELLKEQQAEIERLKAQQPKKGTWEVKIRHHPYPDGREYKKFRCSVCGNEVDDHEDSDFCPWCGADMRKDGEQDG